MSVSENSHSRAFISHVDLDYVIFCLEIRIRSTDQQDLGSLCLYLKRGEGRNVGAAILSGGDLGVVEQVKRKFEMADQLAPSQRHQFVHGGRVIYEWDQTFSEVNIYIQLPAGVRAKELFCNIQPSHLSVGVTPNPPYLDVRHAACDE